MNDNILNCKIADFQILFECKYVYLWEINKDYIINEKNVDLIINTLMVKNKYFNNIVPAYSESVLAYRKLAEWLPLHNAFVLHSAVFDVDGTGIALAAHSGTGKTTHMLLWQKLIGDRLKIVNGDKPIIRFFDDEPETPYAYGTPWNGKEHLGCNMRTILKHICFIERAEKNSCEEMSKADAADLLFNQVYMPKDPQAAINTLQLINRLISCCELWKIKCNMDIDAAQTAYNKIFEMEKENETEIQLCNK